MEIADNTDSTPVIVPVTFYDPSVVSPITELVTIVEALTANLYLNPTLGPRTADVGQILAAGLFDRGGGSGIYPNAGLPLLKGLYNLLTNVDGNVFTIKEETLNIAASTEIIEGIVDQLGVAFAPVQVPLTMNLATGAVLTSRNVRVVDLLFEALYTPNVVSVNTGGTVATLNYMPISRSAATPYATPERLASQVSCGYVSGSITPGPTNTGFVSPAYASTDTEQGVGHTVISQIPVQSASLCQTLFGTDTIPANHLVSVAGTGQTVIDTKTFV